MYDEDLFFNRLIRLRMEKDVSQREMSLSLGQNEGYIKQIENKSSFPSMTAFFYICDYFGIDPKDFFDHDNEYPEIICSINDNLKKMDKNQLVNIAAVINDIVR